VWYTLAVKLFLPSNHEKRDRAVNLRDELAAKMSSAQIADGQAMSERCLRSNYTDCGSQVTRQQDKVIAQSTPRNEVISTPTVHGGFGCGRGSEGSVCFPDGCICGFVINMKGEINSTTVEGVKRLFEIRRAHMGEGETEGFNINSVGGDVASAMAIGRMFRKERAWISTGKDGICVSSCVLILAGAVERPLLLGRGGKIGIHRPYLMTSPQRPVTANAVKEVYARVLQELRGYLREMNVSDRKADDMMAVEPEKVRYLTEADLARYGLAGVDPAEQQTRAIENEAQNIQEANELGLDRREYTRRKAVVNQMCSYDSARGFGLSKENLEGWPINLRKPKSK
jgi:ATP-dependent protease ClpP protease subunit